jgi:hypothetical protein
MTKYTSESGRTIRADQYLSEYITRRNASKNRVTLPKAYWQTKHKGQYIYWSKILNRERNRASALLKVYDLNIILNVLRANDWIISLYVRQLETMIQEEQRKIDIKKTIDSDPVKIIKNTTNVPKRFGSKSQRTKLRD